VRIGVKTTIVARVNIAAHGAIRRPW
jgi:hypothetical protein